MNTNSSSSHNNNQETEQIKNKLSALEETNNKIKDLLISTTLNLQITQEILSKI